MTKRFLSATVILLAMFHGIGSVFANPLAEQYTKMREAIRSELDTKMQQPVLFPKASLMYGVYPIKGMEASFITGARTTLKEAEVSGAVGKVVEPVVVGEVNMAAYNASTKNWAYLTPEAALAALRKTDNDLIAFTTDSAIFTSGGKASADDTIVVVMNKQGRLTRVTTCNNDGGNPYMVEFLSGTIKSMDNLATKLEQHFDAYYPTMINNWRAASAYLLDGDASKTLDCEQPVDAILKTTVIGK